MKRLREISGKSGQSQNTSVHRGRGSLNGFKPDEILIPPGSLAQQFVTRQARHEQSSLHFTKSNPYHPSKDRFVFGPNHLSDAADDT
jgi:hypothetical protein